MNELCLGEIACPHCENHSMPYETRWRNQQTNVIQCETCKSIFEVTFRIVEIHEPEYKKAQDIGG